MLSSCKQMHNGFTNSFFFVTKDTFSWQLLWLCLNNIKQWVFAGECFSICGRAVLKGQRSGPGQKLDWRHDWNAFLHTRDKTLQTHKLEEELSGLTEEGRQCWLDEAGWEWRTRQKKQTVPSKGLPLYKGLKWMSGPSSPPPSPLPMSSWHHSAPADLQLVMWLDAQLKHENHGLLDITRTVCLL